MASFDYNYLNSIRLPRNFTNGAAAYGYIFSAKWETLQLMFYHLHIFAYIVKFLCWYIASRKKVLGTKRNEFILG